MCTGMPPGAVMMAPPMGAMAPMPQQQGGGGYERRGGPRGNDGGEYEAREGGGPSRGGRMQGNAQPQSQGDNRDRGGKKFHIGNF